MIRLAILLLLPLVTLAQAPSDYAPSTLKSVFTQPDRTQARGGEKGTADYFAVMPTFTVAAEYTGESRAIAGNRAQFVNEYAMVRKEPALKAAYQREIRVKSEGSLYWIPVQQEFYPAFAEELKRGQPFVAFVGIAGKSLDRETMVLMMDFSSDKADLEKLQKALQQRRPRTPQN